MIAKRLMAVDANAADDAEQLWRIAALIDPRKDEQDMATKIDGENVIWLRKKLTDAEAFIATLQASQDDPVAVAALADLQKFRDENPDPPATPAEPAAPAVLPAGTLDIPVVGG